MVLYRQKRINHEDSLNGFVVMQTELDVDAASWLWL